MTSSRGIRSKGATCRAWHLAAIVAALVAAGSHGAAAQVSGFVRLSAGAYDATPSFLDGDFGKLIAGDLPADPSAFGELGELRLGLDWEPAVGWRLVLHGVSRHDSGGVDLADGSGLLEAFVEGRYGISERGELVGRFGQFFLPSSRENVEPMWTSPYTTTLSALNSWVAEEVRPIGLDLAWQLTTTAEHRLALAGTVFGGNDTSGTLLAWRGFALHDRPTPTFRSITLPPLPSLPETFPLQSLDGSTPFGGDLDGRPGFAGRARWDAPAGRATIQATAWLNRGDRELHGDEYAWDTDFRWLSTEVELPAGFRLLGEWGTVVSRMGFDPDDRRRAAVDIVADTWYLLGTWARGPFRATLRFDDFVVRDRDRTPGDDNREDGQALTLATILDLADRWRLAVEWVEVEAERPAAAVLGRSVDARSFRLDLSYRW